MSEGSDGTREFELKFNVTPEQLSRLRNKAILKSLSIAEPANSELRSVYFDTQNRDLKARGMSLRVRRIDDRWVQTLKTGRGIVAGLSNPIEIEHRVAGAAPEFDRVRKSDIP
ncbi:MAG: CYTH domain-containing protein, partial [Hyphomicrobiales bacterium]|nr:CYTH domain-containing protein [Hyphomicrobiales bacterium]